MQEEKEKIPADANAGSLEEAKQFEPKAYKKVLEGLKEKGIYRKNLFVTRAHYSMSEEEIPRVAITTEDWVKSFQSNPLNNGVFEETYARTFFSSLWSLIATISHDENLNYLCEILDESPKKISLLLPGSLIDIVQIKVNKEDKEYVNPFSGKVTPIERTTYYNYVIGIKLGKKGQEAADKLFEKKIDE